MRLMLVLLAGLTGCQAPGPATTPGTNTNLVPEGRKALEDYAARQASLAPSPSLPPSNAQRRTVAEALTSDPAFDAWVRCSLIQANIFADRTTEAAETIATAALASCVSLEQDIVTRHTATFGPGFAGQVRGSMREQLIAHVLDRRISRQQSPAPRPLPRT